MNNAPKNLAVKCTCEKCNNIFSEFIFEDFVKAQPPKKKGGVYVIRVKEKGDKAKILELINNLSIFIEETEWKFLKEFIGERIGRLNESSLKKECDVIYVGGAGIREKSNGNLEKRHGNFVSGHTAMYPIWIMLYHKWKLEIGWKEYENYAECASKEKSFKKLYQTYHNSSLPILMKV